MFRQVEFLQTLKCPISSEKHNSYEFEKSNNHIRNFYMT